MDSCENCMFSRCRDVKKTRVIYRLWIFLDLEQYDAKQHECRINTPATDGWPKVEATDWCSKWTRRKENVPMGFNEIDPKVIQIVSQIDPKVIQ